MQVLTDFGRRCFLLHSARHVLHILRGKHKCNRSRLTIRCKISSWAMDANFTRDVDCFGYIGCFQLLQAASTVRQVLGLFRTADESRIRVRRFKVVMQRPSLPDPSVCTNATIWHTTHSGFLASFTDRDSGHTNYFCSSNLGTLFTMLMPVGSVEVTV